MDGQDSESLAALREDKAQRAQGLADVAMGWNDALIDFVRGASA